MTNRAETERWLLGKLLSIGRDDPAGTSVYLDGPAGIGKSHLLGQILGALPETTRILRSRGDERLRHEPFAAVERLAGSNFLHTAGPDPVEAAFEAVDAMCSVGPVVVVVDDAQYLDGASMAVLRRLVWSSRNLPLGVVIAGRNYPEREAVRQIAGQVAARITIPGLTRMELEALVRQQFGRWPGRRLMNLLDVAGGNPLFALEVLNSLRTEGSLLPIGPDQIEALPGASLSVEELGPLILTGLRDLDDSTRELLAAVAVWGGTGVTVTNLAALVYQSAETIAEPISRAIRSGLIGETTANAEDVTVQFVHELYREVVYDDVADGIRRALHRRIGDLLRTSTTAGASVVAEHLLRAAEPHAAAGPEVLIALREAVERSSELAPSVAADLVAGAESLADLGPAAEGMLAQRAWNLFIAGRGREAERLVTDRIGAVSNPGVAAELQVVMLRSLINRGETVAALGIIDRILARPTIPQVARHRAQAQRAWLLLMLGQDRSADFDELIARTEAGGDEKAIAAVLSTIAVTAHLQGDTERAAVLLKRRSELVGHREDMDAQSTAMMWPAVFESARSTPAAGLAVVANVRQRSATLNIRWIEPFLCSIAGSALMLTGDWDGAVAEFTTGLELAEETGTGAVSIAVGNRAYIDAHRGATTAARTRLEEFRHSGRPLQFGQNHPGLAELAVLEAEGRTGPATSLARTLWLPAMTGFPRWMFELAPEVLRVALIGLDRELAESVRRRVLAAPTVPQGQEAIPLLVGGAFDTDPRRLQDALEILTEQGRTMHATFATEELAYAHAVSGDRARATAMLNTAVAGYEAMGALPDRDRALSRCRRLGVRAGNRGRARSGERGWAGLSESERRVAALVREGLTNPEIGSRLFISPRTVQTHVSHILTKTGLRSRVEIASAMPG